MTSIRNKFIYDNETPILTIFCWTYNDKQYITKCIEGILDQITDFPVEIIVHDYASNDGTKEILIEYSLKYPGLFKNILNDENKWSNGTNVSIPLFNKPRGKYISLLHGDDYWIDPYKLSKQVNILETSINYSFCFHKVHYFNNDILSGNYYEQPNNETLNLKQILKNHYIATSSVVLRKSMLKISEDIYSQMYFNDICLELFLSIQGPVFYINQIMGVYRKNSGSISVQKQHLLKGRYNLIKMYKQLRKSLNSKYYILITMLILKNKLGLIKDFLRLNPALKNIT
jgi:glycosyltransferase involved in cell wall biosynthesis